MKLVNETIQKRTDKEGKTRNDNSKNNNWDMFAEQDTFKNDYNVSHFIKILRINYKKNDFSRLYLDK